MQWMNCSDRMDHYVIKKDGTAVDIEYFMATHVPFRDLEFIEFGDTDSKPVHLNEEQIYERYIVNKSGKHQKGDTHQRKVQCVFHRQQKSLVLKNSPVILDAVKLPGDCRGK